ncbi:recombinase family protein [Amycolatopsis thermoflava]|uniref:recombinase family protein n=1 Tax=Amycolatopsis thermoflava TaxID=84480 RepID=UPI003EBA8795
MPPTSANTIIGREFLRVSFDASGRERSPDAQHSAHVRATTTEGNPIFGITLHDKPYREVGSASQFRSRERKDFPRLITDLQNGTFGAHLLILWEGSRGSRDVGEWFTLVTMCKFAGVKIYIHTKQKIFDPANPLEENDLHNEAVQSARRSAEISEAVTREMRVNLADGKPHGTVPYGFKRVYDNETGELIGDIDNPEEADVIRELIDRVCKRHAMSAIARDFYQRGIRSRKGKPLTGKELTRLARHPRYAGYRTHIANWRDVRNKGAKPQQELVKASWCEIVPPDKWQRAQRILADPKRRTTRPGRALHLLSMLAKCDVCANWERDNETGHFIDPIAGRDQSRGFLGVRNGKAKHPKPEYFCHDKNHVTIGKERLDEYVEDAIITYLSREDVYQALTAGQTNTREVDEARADLIAAEHELEEITRELEESGLSSGRSVRILAAAERRVERARAHLEAVAVPAPLSGILGGPRGDIRRRWEALPMAARREVVRAVCTPSLLGEIRLGRAHYVGRYADREPVQDRVTWNRV